MKDFQDLLSRPYISTRGLEVAAGLPINALGRLPAGQEPLPKHWPALLRLLCHDWGEVRYNHRLVTYWEGVFTIQYPHEGTPQVQIPETQPTMLAALLTSEIQPYIVRSSPDEEFL